VNVKRTVELRNIGGFPIHLFSILHEFSFEMVKVERCLYFTGFYFGWYLLKVQLLGSDVKTLNSLDTPNRNIFGYGILLRISEGEPCIHCS
jgi:hypothetical protein